MACRYHSVVPNVGTGDLLAYSQHAHTLFSVYTAGTVAEGTQLSPFSLCRARLSCREKLRARDDILYFNTFYTCNSRR